jgi:hypothetical protein
MSFKCGEYDTLRRAVGTYTYESYECGNQQKSPEVSKVIHYRINPVK